MKNGRPSRRPQSGFTVVELLIVLAVTLILTLIMLQLFNLSDRIARVQTRISEMQQALRIGQYDMVRLTRMAGRGGLPSTQGGATSLPTGVAVSVRGNVTGAAARLIPGDNTSPKLLEGTDLITLRGVFSTQIFQLNSLDKATFHRWDAGANNPGSGTDAAPATTTYGELQLCGVSPAGIAQPLTPFEDLIDAAADPLRGPSNEALVLVSPLDQAFYAVIQMDPANSAKTASTCPGMAGVTIRYISNSDPVPVAYRTLQPPGAFNLPPQLTSAIYVGILEEYRYYVREDRADPTDPASDLVPVLSRGRFYPGTEIPYANNAANMTVDIASGIVDLQATYGIDTNADGQVIEGTTAADRKLDEWLGNSRIADAANAAPETPIAGKLAYLRISTLARTERRDPDYQAPVLDRSEDHTYAFDTPDRTNGRTNQMYRRRQLQTVIDLRNLS